MEQNISFRIEGIELLEYAIIAPDKIIEPQTIFKFDISFYAEGGNFCIIQRHISSQCHFTYC